jgi:hypothetical protein
VAITDDDLLNGIDENNPNLSQQQRRRVEDRLLVATALQLKQDEDDLREATLRANRLPIYGSPAKGSPGETFVRSDT